MSKTRAPVSNPSGFFATMNLEQMNWNYAILMRLRERRFDFSNRLRIHTPVNAFAPTDRTESSLFAGASGLQFREADAHK